MSRVRDLLGWIAAGTVTAGLFAGAAVAALRLPEMPAGTGALVAVALDLSVGIVATAPALVAEAENAAGPPPSVPAQVMPAPDLEEPQVTPAPPAEDPPMLSAPMPEVPRMDLPVAADQPILPMAAQPALPGLETSPRPQARPERRLATVDRPPSERPAPEQPERVRRASEQPPQGLEQRAAAQAAPQAAGAQQVARPAEERRAAGGQAAARYGDVVMRQIAGLRRQKAPERGAVTVGFEIGPDGRLRRVAVVVSSGSEALDSVAVEHIRRAAPFPPPPQGAATRFAFEFVGR